MSRRLSDDEIVELLKATDTVPEPSPLFWEHAARRVRAAVDAETPRRSNWIGRLLWTGGGLAAASIAALLVLQPRPVHVPPRAVAVSPVPPSDDVTGLDEDSWTFVASFSEDFDVDAAERAGLLAPGESTDRAMQVLDAEERAELASLLHHALEGPEI
jgi:hypothetical protein